jgi:nucleoside 2-deoxyribosyltransferase
MQTFTGDILYRIKSQIETASLVIADLTGANPNVYLEVGYAWGKGRPTLLLAKKGHDLKFDVQGQKCIFYENIVELEKRLQVDLPTLANYR